MRSCFHRRDSGYVLMAIMFFMALLVIGLLATAPAIKTQIQRDREEEMIHRGAQYSRAIKRYFKKFGRYPGSIEDLKQTNNIRFLRKEYKDPMSPDGKGKWRLLHIGDVKIGQSNVGTPVSAMGTLGGNSNPSASTSAFGSPSTFGASGSTLGGSPSGFGASGSTLGGSTSAFGGSSGTLGGPGTMMGAGANTGVTGAASGIQSPSGGVMGAQGSTSSPSSMTTSTSAIGGGVVIGVASLSEKQGLHEFNEKTHYNEWYFFYDATMDRGGLITGPFTGKTFGAAGGVGTPAGALGQQQPGAQQPSGFGQPSSFGQPSTFGQPSGFGQQQQPPQQQQQPPR